MIREQTQLVVADNTGAKKVECFRVLGGTGRRFATVGDVIVVSVKSAIPRAAVKKGDKSKAVIVRTAKEVRTVPTFASMRMPLSFSITRANRVARVSSAPWHGSCEKDSI